MIEEMRAKIQAGQFEFSKHAVDQSILRRGFTRAGRPLHFQCSYPSRPLVKLITLYEPNPAEWMDFRVRRT